MPVTDIKKNIRRRTIEPYNHHGRRIVVQIGVGDTISMREERTRKWFTAPIRRVMQQLIVWNVDAERAAKKAARKAKR